jgi:hypothetical protein
MLRHAFDDLTKAFAAGTSRRSLLRGLLGAATGAVALASRDVGAQRRNQVGICHKSWAWSSDWRYITIDARDERRIEAHLEHGDTVDPDFENDPNNCGGCGNTCEAPANAYATCNGGWCGFSCSSGYEWNGSACVEIAPPTCPSFSTSEGICYHQEFDSISGQWCWFPTGPIWGVDTQAECEAANEAFCAIGQGCWSWRTSAP